METISVYEAVRRATDPYGPDGLATSSARPPAREVIDRLHALGFDVVPTGNHRFIASHQLGGAASPCQRCGAYGSAPIHATSVQVRQWVDGIEQYQVESR